MNRFSKRVASDALPGVAGCPQEGATDAVTKPDVGHGLATQVCGRHGDATDDEIVLDLGEPDLDLVEPGVVGGWTTDRDGAALTSQAFTALA